MKRLIAAAVWLAAAPASADDKADAQALFDRGVADLQAGKVDEACKELAASLAKVSDSGTKGALAICTTKQGKIATAWQLWRDLAVTAPSDEMKSDAGKNAVALEPRLPRYTVKAPAPAIEGLTVTVNGSRVDLGIGVPLPVDPGKVVVSATAPGYRDYTGEATATEGQTIVIEVPALVAAPKPPPGPEPGTPQPAASRNTLGLVVAGAGGASLLGGVVFGLRARSKWNDAKALCGDIDNCPGDVFARANKNYDAARTSATLSTVLVGVGVLAIAGGTVWYLRSGKARETTALVPIAAPDRAGVALVGSWR